MNKSILIILLSIPLIFSSCKPEDYPPIIQKNANDNYFPLILGFTKYYDITEITIDKPINRFDTINYKLKEQIIEKIIDNTGHDSFVIEKSIYNNTSMKYEVVGRWTTQIYDNIAFTIENNIRFVKLRFPLFNGKTWDSNLFNILEPNNCIVEKLHEKFKLNNFNFDSTLNVIYQADSSLIHKNYSREVYAKNIGLILKQKINIESQEVIPNVSIDNRISTGTIYYQEITFYGIEPIQKVSSNKYTVLSN